MNTDLEILEIIADMVPQWYVSNNTKGTIDLKLNETELKVSVIRNSTPIIYDWSKNCIEYLKQYLQTPRIELPSLERECLKDKFTISWLILNKLNADWENLIDHCKNLASRTYENNNIGFTYIVKNAPEKSGNHSLLNNKEQKLLDVLSDSQFTYFETDSKWNLLDYKYISYNHILPSTEYKLAPELIYPYQSIMNSTDFGIKLTKRSDLLIFNKYSLIATKRKGNWHIYDSTNLKNSLTDILSFYGIQYRIGANLFEIILDLSYRRHGALLILLPLIKNNNQIKLRDFVINHNSFNKTGYSSPLREAMLDRIGEFDLSSKDFSGVNKPLLLELASMDGAMILSSVGKVLSFGSMLKLHENANSSNSAGARSTAAISAFHYDCLPIKISSDGEITIFFKTDKSQTEPFILKFL